MTKTKEHVVRIVKPSSKPALPKKKTIPSTISRKKRTHSLPKALNILIGSGMGIVAGVVIYIMLKSSGINFGGVESSIIIGLPAILGILISCLGLIGLASYVSVQRTKEIGIRKVLGASGAGIFILIIREFLKWTLYANLIAWPVAWFIIDKMMRGYAYRINIGWMIFVSSGAVALLMAVVTVGYQAIKAALADPVDSLRYE